MKRVATLLWFIFVSVIVFGAMLPAYLAGFVWEFCCCGFKAGQDRALNDTEEMCHRSEQLKSVPKNSAADHVKS